MESIQEVEFRYSENMEKSELRISAIKNGVVEGSIRLNLHQSESEKSFVVLDAFSEKISPETAKSLIKEALMYSWEAGYDFALSYSQNLFVKNAGFIQINPTSENILGYALSWNGLNYTNMNT